MQDRSNRSDAPKDKRKAAARKRVKLARRATRQARKRSTTGGRS